MWSPGNGRRRLMALTLAAAVILVLGLLSLQGDLAHGDRLEQDPKIYLPLAMKSHCSDWWRDDFSDPGSGWPTGDSDDFTVEYVSGELHTRINVTSGGIWPHPGVYASNFTLKADARSDSGIYGLAFGLRFELEPFTFEFYSFELGPGNYWAVRKGDWGEYWHLALDSGYSSYITSGMNHLKVVRRGSQIEAYVNGHPLSTVTDSSFLGSRIVGLTARTLDTAPVDAYFDNFAVCPVDSAPGAGGPSMGQATIFHKGTPPTIEFWPR